MRRPDLITRDDSDGGFYYSRSRCHHRDAGTLRRVEQWRPRARLYHCTTVPLYHCLVLMTDREPCPSWCQGRFCSTRACRQKTGITVRKASATNGRALSR
eukprot:8028927-Pyramimonas_sp.AAC.1